MVHMGSAVGVRLHVGGCAVTRGDPRRELQARLRPAHARTVRATHASVHAESLWLQVLVPGVAASPGCGVLPARATHAHHGPRAWSNVSPAQTNNE